jgi:TRAP-type mannitol/chloroaromatic compound transport system substrate-binding protein
MTTEKAKVTRRKFLRAGAVAAGATAATLAMPNVSRAQTVTLKMQGSWSATDIFNEMAMQYVERVNSMSGGRLKIEYFTGGAVVKPFEVQNAVHSGTLDAGHTVPVYWYGKHKAASMFGTGPQFGQNAHHMIAWMWTGGGQALYDELVQKILKLNVVGFFAMPMPTQPFGWFKKEVKSAADLKGLKYRTVGLAADLFQAMGAKVTQLPGGEIVPALQRGVIDSFEFNNPTSDMRFGAQDVSKIYMMGSFHQASECFEIIFTKSKFDSLPKEHQAILKYAVEAANTANFNIAMENYSRDLEILRDKHKVKILRTPADVMGEQLKAWDQLAANLNKDPFIKKIYDSQKAWFKRVAYYELFNAADYKQAYEHVYGKLGF